jgi:hypothetical protein
LKVPLIVSVCGDAGGANALAPVLELLRHEGRVALDSFAYLQAQAVFERRALVFSPIPPDAASSWPTEIVAQRAPQLVVTATSHNGRDYEKHFIAAARAHGVPSLALLDFWSNYRARLAAADGTLRYVPDRIAVMDAAARDALVEIGVPGERVRITGQPAFDALAARRAGFDAAARMATRRSLGAASDDVLVVFASQPLRELYGAAEAAGGLGYDEHSVLDALVAALEPLASGQRRISLVIRPHPRESARDHAARRSAAIRIGVAADGEQYDTVMAADLVVGMTSILLVEACHLGCAVLSLQPGAREPNILPVPAAAALSVVTDRRRVAAEVQSALSWSLQRSQAAPLGRAGPSATARVAHCIYSMLGIRSEVPT